jgi:hypothetical protein
MSTGLRWTLLALLALGVAAVVAFLAIHTVSAQIGISSEPPAAGSSLAPAPKSGAKPSPPRTDSSAPSATTATQPQPAPVQGQTGDDHTGRGEAGGGGDD